MSDEKQPPAPRLPDLVEAYRRHYAQADQGRMACRCGNGWPCPTLANLKPPEPAAAFGHNVMRDDIEAVVKSVRQQAKKDERERIRKWLLWNAPSPDHKSPREALEWAAANMEDA